ncbi:MAG TPA: response regulator [Lacipirellulaceae bacterium]|jgi:two-component system NtrC family sensor kinase
MSEKPRILIVEDSPTQALRLQLELEAEKWSAASVGTADEALARIEETPPDVIIVDYCLPGMSGDELCRRVRMNINTRAIPIIMLTADEDEETEVRGLDSGADDFFKKSADTEILVIRIRAMLDRPKRNESVLAHNETAFRRARVLAVDDSETYLSHLRCLLQGEGYAVDAVIDPKEALCRLEASSYDLALVDLVMPEIDGIDVCRRIVAMRSQLDNPIAVLMLTGREAKEDLTRALEAGADDFVGKSSDQAVLKGRIRALLRRKFFQEENQRISEELKNKEVEAIRARAETETALARAADERRLHAETVAIALRQAKADLEKANQELTRSNDELRQFAFVASHDLQEPLRSITSFCNLLKEDYEGKIDEQADNYIERIVNGAKRMKALVMALLNYSRVSHDEQLAVSEVDFREIVSDVLANLQSAIDETGAVVSVGEMPTVVGDRSQLVQLLQNLIGNAMLYRGQQPPRIQIDAQRDNELWQFWVRDNGIGIAAEYHQQIFEIFRRLHSRDEYPGTGIGLAVCKKIVQRHGGQISVDSQIGAGSVFRFTIPYSPEEASDEQEKLLATSI